MDDINANLSIDRLLCSCYTLGEDEQKLLYHLIWHDKAVSAKMTMDACGLTEDTFPPIADKLLSRVVTLYNKDQWIKTHWLSFLQYSGDVLSFSFEDHLKEYLPLLKERFVLLNIRMPVQFSGIYPGKLYTLLKQLKSAETKLHIVSVEEIRDMFELTPSMSTVGKIRERVLDPSLSQINRIADIQAGYEPLKSGKSIIAFQFTIRPNKKNLRDTPEDMERKKILQKMSERIFSFHNIPPEDLDEHTQGLPLFLLEPCLTYTLNECLARKSRLTGDPVRYFYAVLRSAIHDPDRFMNTWEKTNNFREHMESWDSINV